MANRAASPTADSACDRFPETQTHVLRLAASDDWQAFLAQYLRPCWREISIICRQKGIALSDTDDLFQELLSRLVKQGRMKAQIASPTEDVPLANLPARYLQGRERGLFTARFRTYLQQTILNVVREHLRSQRRGRQQQLESRLAELATYIERSVTDTFDQQAASAILAAAAGQLRDESRSAATKALRRQYAVLYALIVWRRSPEQIAQRAEISRSTAAGIISTARARLLAILQEKTGTSDREELKRWLYGHVELLVRAFEQFPP